jgi:MYXO-CTERM domain-containing protein
MKEKSMRALCRGLSFGLTVLFAGCTDAGGPASPKGVVAEPIVGGTADSTSRSVIGILTRQGELCSGSLILPNLVLTARHCVASISNSDGSVACGVTTFGSLTAAGDFAISWDDNLRDNIDEASVYGAKAVRVPQDPAVCGNDIALIELSSNIPASEAKPIEPRLDPAPKDDEVFNAVGYGLTNPNDQSGSTAGRRMRFDGAHVSCVGSDCRMLGGTATEWAGDAPVCSGDSGGPALDSAGRVMGVASRGPEMCDQVVYSGVSTWKSFILDGAKAAVDDGGYDPPGWVTGMTTDGGVPNDAGTPSDGGTPSDAGTGMMDGGSPTDAGMLDGGSPTDAGTVMLDGGAPMDAGMGAPDAGVPNDAGMGISDAGVPSDAGKPDAGTPSDAGTLDAGTAPPDAGTPPADAGIKMTDAGSGSRSSDGSESPPADAGCGCRTPAHGAPSGFSGSAALVAVLLAGARRRRSGRRAR